MYIWQSGWFEILIFNFVLEIELGFLQNNLKLVVENVFFCLSVVYVFPLLFNKPLGHRRLIRKEERNVN